MKNVPCFYVSRWFCLVLFCIMCLLSPPTEREKENRLMLWWCSIDEYHFEGCGNVIVSKYIFSIINMNYTRWHLPLDDEVVRHKCCLASDGCHKVVGVALFAQNVDYSRCICTNPTGGRESITIAPTSPTSNSTIISKEQPYFDLEGDPGGSIYIRLSYI